MVQTRRARRRRRTARALPRIQPDVMMIAACRKKHRLLPVTLRHLEAQYIAIETKRAVEIGYLEMYMADADTGVDRNWLHIHQTQSARGSNFVQFIAPHAAGNYVSQRNGQQDVVGRSDLPHHHRIVRRYLALDAVDLSANVRGCDLAHG